MSNIDKRALRKKINRRLNDAFGFQRTSGGKHTTISLSIDECKSVLVALDELEAAEKRIAEPVSVPDERAAFETFMEKRFKDCIDRRLVKNGDGEYFAWDMQVAWIVWQERAAMLQAGNHTKQHLDMVDNSGVANENGNYPVIQDDALRMDWLVSKTVDVREPMVYGSHSIFWSQTITDEDDDYHATKLREQIDAAMAAEKAAAPQHEVKK